MQNGEWRKRIVCDPELHHGEPCIRGTRLAVSVIVASVADLGIEGLLTEFPQITRDDLKAALYFASDAAHNTLVA